MSFGWFSQTAAFVRREAVLVISALAALVSAFFVPPSLEYIGYIDFRVLSLLFCLMAVVAGFQREGLFELLSQRLLRGGKDIRFLSFLLVTLTFFSSMLITNDVALITFVPFAIMALRCASQTGHIIWIVTLQTVAANIGSMLTPVGNPQNLYLFSFYGISPERFFAVTAPVTVLSFFLLAGASLCVKQETVRVEFAKQANPSGKGRVWAYAVLFLLSLAAVFRMIPHWAVLGIVILALFFLDRRLFQKVDYCLLLTFVFFFIFAGNLGRLEPVRSFLSSLLEGRTLLVSAGASQIISNVPAAVLLSSFTEDWKGLLLGANIGGLGTLIASLASVISFKQYARIPGARPLRYLAVFSAVNFVMLALLMTLAFLM